ncbi:hypothetical protein EAI_12026 [Harpegnathos saltator]|uniref:Uncharacterized protein n=1 Tax=Harpegnathos saltator TaxID=610380 RepID=E2B6U4_HARSA|nr:hypothetical protein EAI_12026 [Harpegnathos saltator]
MALLWMVVSFAFSLFLMPCLMLVLGIIFLASIGKSLGVRRLYIKLLLALFENLNMRLYAVRLSKYLNVVGNNTCLPENVRCFDFHLNGSAKNA